MTREEYEQLSLKYWQHYQHACEKHPFFAKGIMEPGATPSEWALQAKGSREYRDDHPTAENVLGAEIFEILAAAAEGNLEQAHYEIADAVAVLIRLDEQLEELHERQLNPSTYKDKNNGKEA